MTGKAAARILIVILVIVAAHAIKPFSLKNLTMHLLNSSRSFAFVLPDSFRGKFDRVNRLAMTLSGKLLDPGEGGREYTNQFAANSQPASWTIPALQPEPSTVPSTVICKRKERSQHKTNRSMIAVVNQGELEKTISWSVVSKLDPQRETNVLALSMKPPITLPSFYLYKLSLSRPLNQPQMIRISRLFRSSKSTNRTTCENRDDQQPGMIARLLKPVAERGNSGKNSASVLKIDDQATETKAETTDSPISPQAPEIPSMIAPARQAEICPRETNRSK